MKQKIKVLLFLITVAGFPLASSAGYMGSQDHWKSGSYSNDYDGEDWFVDSRHDKSRKRDFDKHKAHFIKEYFHDKQKWDFDFRNIDLKWLHVDDRWFHIFLDHFGWIFDGDISKPKPGVPEPSALILLAMGILLIAGMRRTR
jgi:hypothetical protein